MLHPLYRIVLVEILTLHYAFGMLHQINNQSVRRIQAFCLFSKIDTAGSIRQGYGSTFHFVDKKYSFLGRKSLKRRIGYLFLGIEGGVGLE